jgi:hypothetical protein
MKTGTDPVCGHCRAMPRYFFDYLNHPDLCDRAGVILPNDAAAKQEAIARAHDAKSTHSLVSFNEADEIAVRREQEKPFYKVRLK